MWSNDIKCKYMCTFPLQNLARKGLTLTGLVYGQVIPVTGAGHFSDPGHTSDPWMN